MTELDSVQYLKKCILGHEIITKVMALFRDAGEEITFRTEFKDYIGTVVGIHYLDERDHIRVMAGRMMQMDLPLLETPLPWIQTNLVQSLDRVGNVRVNVNGSIDDPICSDTEDTC